MPVSVTCESCFETYRVKEQFLGKRIRCKACGSPIAVREMDGHAPSRTNRRPAEKQLWKSPAIIVCCLLGVVLLGTGVWFAVTQLGGKSKADIGKKSGETANSDNGKTPTKTVNDFFAKPPSDRRIAATQENWTPVPAIVGELSKPHVVGDFEIRIPKGMWKMFDNREIDDLDSAVIIVWRRRSKPPYDREPDEEELDMRKYEQLQLHIDPADNWTAERIERDFVIQTLKRIASDPYRRRQSWKRGKLNGKPAYRHQEAVQIPNRGTFYSVGYLFVDSRGRLIQTHLITPSGPDTETFKTLDTAARTIRGR